MLNSFSKNTLFCAVDIGTASTKVAIAQYHAQEWQILGFGFQPSEGLKKGSILELEKTIRSVRFALEEAELKAGAKAQVVITNIAGPFVASKNSRGAIPIRHSYVQQEDIQEVISLAKTSPLAAEHRILHCIPQFFSIDDHQLIRDPLHMSGIRLQADVHLITASVHAVKTKLQVLSHFGLQANHVVVDQLAAGSSTLLPDEKQLGVAIIDIGSGCTKVAVYKEGILLDTMIVPIGSDHVTADIALAFKTPVSAAEVLKVRYGGILIADKEYEQHVLNVPSLADKNIQQIRQDELYSVITLRIEEIFQMVADYLKEQQLIHAIGSGVVLTGGGVNIEGIVELASRIFDSSVRLGKPGSSSSHEFFCTPQAATLMGLLEWGRLQEKQQPQSDKKEFGRFWSQLKNWLTG